MKYVYLLFTALLFLTNCKKAVFDHITEGAGGLLIGVRMYTNPSIVLSNFPTNMDEGASVTISLRFSSSVSDETITITSTNSKLSFSENPIVFNASNATINRQITMTAIEDADALDENEEVTFTSLNYGSLTSTISIKDLVTRGINLSLPAQSEEDVPKQVDVSLRVEPPEGTVTLVLTPSDPSIQLGQTNLTFTSVNYTINDQFNDNRAYSITASIDSESVTKSTTVVDNDNYTSDLSTLLGESFNSGLNPSIGIMDSNLKFYVALKDASNSSKLGMYSCDLSGANCLKMSKTSLLLDIYNGSRPKLAIDQDTNSIFVTTTNSTFATVVWKINNNLTIDSRSTNIKDGANILYNFDYDMYNPYPANVIVNGNLINLYDNSAGTTFFQSIYPDLFIYDFPSAVRDYGLQNYAVGSRGFLYNNSDNYLYKALTVGADLFLSSNTLYYPVIEKIDTNGNSVGSLEIFSHLGGLTPDLGIDTINNKIILLTANYSLGGIPFIFRCDLTAFIASSCTEHDISSGMPSSTYFPKLNIDLVNQKLLVLAYNGDILYLYHCNLDATNCKVTPISGTKSILTSSDEHNFDSIIDTVNNRLLVVFTDKNSGKLIFTRFGLGGF